MSDQISLSQYPKRRPAILVAGLAAIAGAALWSEFFRSALLFALRGLIEVSPLVVPGILLAAWIMASGADTFIARSFERNTVPAILAASAIGAITPVCGVTVLPLMAGLLATGVPLAPVMAFWLSSPVTDPAMLATTAATLGLDFALGKTVAAFGLGMFGGGVTAVMANRDWAKAALRNTRFARQISAARCQRDAAFDYRVWRSVDRRNVFLSQAWSTTKLIVICLLPAFGAEYALNAMLTPGDLVGYLGKDVWWAIPAAVFVGAPAYIDGYAALPLTRGLIDNGMSPGTAMAFLVSGGVVSIWGALAIFPVLKLKPFVLYLGLAVTGSLAAGYLFEWISW